MSRSERIAANIARQIVRNKTKRRFSALHADAVREETMSTPIQTSQDHPTESAASSYRGQKLSGTPTSSGITSGMTISENSAVPNPTATKVDHKNLVTGEDFRKSGDTAAASVAEAADNGGPRQPMRQFDAPPSVTSKKHGSGSAETQNYEGIGA